MKALNRAIARTVSQIARHAGEGCHVPMIMALENHLDALLEMERKMLEGVQDWQCWTTERVAVFNRWENAKPPWENAQPTQHANDNEQPAPDVIDMTDPRNWQVGDVVVRIAPTFGPMFDMGDEYVVSKIDADEELVYISTNYERPYEYPFGLLRSDPPFQWLRHGEVQS